jgi:hypothetical protein
MPGTRPAPARLNVLMTRQQSVARFRRLARVLLPAIAITGLASCSSNAPVTDRPSASTSVQPNASPAPTASPVPSLPAAADGMDPNSCSDGRCEIRVTGPTTVPIPAQFGLGSIEVTAIGAQTVTMVVPLTRSNFSSDGGCSALITGQSASAPAHMDLTCHAGEKTIVNEMALEVAGIADGAAVIRIAPAT